MMRALSSRVVVILIIVVVVAVGAACAGPSVAPPRVRDVDHTPELVARGRYLATHVAVCVECHSTRDWHRFSGPTVEGTVGRGGETFTRAQGFPGTIVAPNITPFALSSWSDGEIERAIVSGVSREGRALFPVMPYPAYAKLCQDDVDALVAWIRTLAPIPHTPPATALSFPMNLIVNTIPKDAPRPPCPSPTDEVARGAYLATAAGCVECHSPVQRGRVIEGQEYAGGRTLRLASGTVTSPNLTRGGVLGVFTPALFVARMRAHGTPSSAAVVEEGAMQTSMPWTAYAGMTDEDLRVLFAYLQTLPAKPD